ncbi:magnesium-translocating P-type ATPase [Niabella sp. CC-SYL272]|uniref:magnesium-translocating P-type ATPase n=1 Tax=Niabella agricola TaxID=2891571 RepID=UPI001F4498A3|nr:magnesium-translocating P-type ATPase [Niabella agricola]MCF3107685.1 magnesium-translocating P-type ATPase [Niabella agricola]
MTDQPPLNTENFWSRTAEDLFTQLSCTKDGLSSGEAADRLKKYGLNLVKERNRSSVLLLFLRQFKSPITIMLIITAVLSAFLGDVSDMMIILVIVLSSSYLSFWQEKGADKAVRELLRLVQLRFSVIRDGCKQEVPFELAVPGDIVALSAGDIIPADCLLLDSNELFVDEATFTGETFPVGKRKGSVALDAPLMNRVNTLFMGSSVVSGKARALVIHTGVNTEFGKIANSLQTTSPETDFEKGIRRFGYLLMELTLLLVLSIFAINVLLHKPALDSFLFSLALAVGLTPQLLPAIVSINLSTGASRMAAQKVVVKRLSSIENLGSMNVLCSDKTGTLTEGRVVLKETLDAKGNGSQKVAQYAWINAALQQGFHNVIDDAITTTLAGDGKQYKLIGEVPYDFIRKRLSVQVLDDEGSLMVTKGAFKNVLDCCNSVETADGIVSINKFAAELRQRFEMLSAGGVRILGIAYRRFSASFVAKKEDEIEMVFLGFVTFFDPLKSDIVEVLKKMNASGVSLKIITGDNAFVSARVAADIGFKSVALLTGMELREISDAALLHRVRRVDVFAEMEPNQKERVIRALKKTGCVVGYMGDGINDASALHAADVGISVDSAADVAKQAADIVLMERDLGVLLNGIIEGRKTFANTMKYIFIATSANFGNMFSMAGASLFLPFLPLLPKQILLTNLLTDFPETAIARDNVDRQSIKHPQRWNLSFIRRFMIVFGLLSSVFDYLTFAVLIFLLHASEKEFQSGWFTESVVSAVMVLLIVRTRRSF